MCNRYSVGYYTCDARNITAVMITHGRNDSTLRDHPAFSRNITQAHKTRGPPSSNTRVIVKSEEKEER